MKVKIFFQNPEQMESVVNEWLKGNPGAEIKFVTQGESNDGIDFWSTISVWYEISPPSPEALTKSLKELKAS